MKGIDCATRLTAKTAAAIKQAGYSFAGRYLVPVSYSKALTNAEAKAITDAGLSILSVWETTASRAKCGASAGATDGARAYIRAREVGMPESGVIYFAVDYDAPESDYAAIEAYLRAAKGELGNYGIGVYGSYGVVEAMHQRGAAQAYWQCLAWSKGKKSAFLNVYQGEFNKTVGGVNVDINDCFNLDRAGIWTYKTEEKTMTGKEILEVLTDEEAYNLIMKAQKHASKLKIPEWATIELDAAIAHGITDGENPMQFIPRYQAAIMANRAAR